MKVEVSRIGTRGYAITRGDLGIFQRSHPGTVADPPLSIKEKLICDLCETILATQREAMERCKTAIQRLHVDGESPDTAYALSYGVRAICALIEENKGGKTCPE